MGNETISVKECLEPSDVKLNVATATFANEGYILLTIEKPLTESEEIILDLKSAKALSTFLTDYIEKTEELQK